MNALLMRFRKRENRVNHMKGAVNHIFFTIIFFVLAVYAVSLITLLLWAFITSLKTNADYVNNPFSLPAAGTNVLANYIAVFEKFHVKGTASYFVNGKLITHKYDVNFLGMLFNSLIYAGFGSVIQAVVPAVVAYILCKYDFKFSKFVYGVALITYIIPIVGNYPSVVVVMQNLGLYDSFIGNFIQKFNFAGMYFFIYYAFFEGISNSYIEAAELDGASQFQILTRIILPQAKNIIFTVIVIIFVQLWNDYQTPLLYLPSHPTIAYGVHYITTQADNTSALNLRDTTVRLASCMSLAVPTLLMFIFLKEKLMSNLSMGGLKE
ncbi:MAG: carbohydrate ABC transporter permease [Bacilli bacterium]|nr:carbohydrate ABC transporter permease [Bacilli bacterium]